MVLEDFTMGAPNGVGKYVDRRKSCPAFKNATLLNNKNNKILKASLAEDLTAELEGRSGKTAHSTPNVNFVQQKACSGSEAHPGAMPKQA